MSDLLKEMKSWDHCLPGNINIERVFDEATSRIEELEAALKDAADAIESWGAYASEYFQDKHNLKGDIAAARAVLGEKQP